MKCFSLHCAAGEIIYWITYFDSVLTAVVSFAVSRFLRLLQAINAADNPRLMNIILFIKIQLQVRNRIKKSKIPY